MISSSCARTRRSTPGRQLGVYAHTSLYQSASAISMHGARVVPRDVRGFRRPSSACNVHALVDSDPRVAEEPSAREFLKRRRDVQSALDSTPVHRTRLQPTQLRAHAATKSTVPCRGDVVTRSRTSRRRRQMREARPRAGEETAPTPQPSSRRPAQGRGTCAARRRAWSRASTAHRT